MTTLTTDQIRQLKSYSIYVEEPKRPLFTLEDLQTGGKIEELIGMIETISKSPNRTVAASFFMRRLGMFYAMQLYHLAVYDEMWQGSPETMHFGAIEEFGMLTISTFTDAADWQYVEEDRRRESIRQILESAHTVIGRMRSVSSVSPLTLWENIFGFWLWQYHVLLTEADTAPEAEHDLALLKDDELWTGIASHSRFAKYLNGCSPSSLLNTTVRTTCCFSKDVPGLMQCGFCPLK